MKLWIHSYFLVAPLLCEMSQAYWLDMDCRIEIAGPLIEAVEAAFDRVHLALGEINKVIKNSNDANDDVRDLAMLLFESQDLDYVASVLYWIREVDEQLSSDLAFDQIPPENVVFQCAWTEESIVPAAIDDGNGGTRPGLYNQEVGYEVTKSMLEQCFQGTGIGAYTAVIAGNKIPSIIQLCPWKYQDLIDHRQREIEKYKNDRLPKPTITEDGISNKDKAALEEGRKVLADLAVDFPFILIHELSHTKAGGLSYDSTSRNGDPPKNEMDPYGWKNCVGMKNPRNADSIAFFTTMVTYIIYSGQRPTEDGKMERIPGWTAPDVPTE